MWRRRLYTQLRWEELFDAEGLGAVDDHIELRTALQHVLGRLPEAQKKVVEYHYLGGHSYRSTADLLGLRVDTVRSRLQKARQNLKHEVLKMSKSERKPMDIDLSKQDLIAMRWATKIVSKDPERAVLGGLYLDAEGTMVATDGHRMMMWHTEAMKKQTDSVLLAAWHTCDIPDGDRAKVQIDEENTAHLVAGKSDHPISRLESSKFPQYKRVIPESCDIDCSFNTSDFLQIITMIEAHLHPEHPLNSDEDWEYNPSIEIQLSFSEQKLSLVVTRDMGYSRKEAEVRELPPHNPIADWVFSASIPCDLNVQSVKEEFRIWVDYNYLKTCISILSDLNIEQTVARFNAADTAMLFESPDGIKIRLLQMPLRMPSTDATIRQTG